MIPSLESLSIPPFDSFAELLTYLRETRSLVPALQRLELGSNTISAPKAKREATRELLSTMMGVRKGLSTIVWEKRSNKGPRPFMPTVSVPTSDAGSRMGDGTGDVVAQK